jgi:hypothetical protein
VDQEQYLTNENCQLIFLRSQTQRFVVKRRDWELFYCFGKKKENNM